MSFRDSIRVTMSGVEGKTRLTIRGVVYEGRCVEIRGGCVYVDGVLVNVHAEDPSVVNHAGADASIQGANRH